MSTGDFDYDLPPELIAQTPLEQRDSSRLMVAPLDGAPSRHTLFSELPRILSPGDVLVMNDSRVIPARLVGRRAVTGGRAELLLLERLSPGVWRALARPGRRLGPGAVVEFSSANAEMSAEVLEVDASGARIVRLRGEDYLGEVGAMPLPPYIREPLRDGERYQTVYSRVEGSVAAPTAGLHFTPALLSELRAAGVETAFVTLHVGWGTFRLVKVDDPASHEMHAERYTLSQQAADAVNAAKSEGRRVIAVGTTPTRLLEHVALSGGSPSAPVEAGSGWADLFIRPGHRFLVIDGLLTNFHLPRSTLLMLVSAFAGRELVLKRYREAIERRYRFYSFGDATLFLDDAPPIEPVSDY